MFCEKCGKEIADDAVICIGCGRALRPVIMRPAMDTRVKRTSLGLLLGSLIGGGILSFIGIGLFIAGFVLSENYSYGSSTGAILAVFGVVIFLIGIAGFIFGSVLFCIYLHRAWKMIQDGYARTSPGEAVGFLFIPFFSLYWNFQALWGWAKDYNSFIQRNAISDAPKMPEGLFLAWAILSAVSGIPYFIVLTFIPLYIIGLISTVKTCKAVNFFADRKV
ncbi:MAG: zinc ribbon domain-containing protein [Nitrospirota bacterium]